VEENFAILLLKLVLINKFLISLKESGHFWLRWAIRTAAVRAVVFGI
jgi:hypothetical protein